MRLRSAGARCGLERRENASRSETIRPTRAVSLVTCPRYLRNSSMRSGGTPSSFSMRCSSMERLRTPEMGLLISCATLAESWPSDASRSLCSSFFCAAWSCWVRSSTLVSSFCVNWLISPSAEPQALAHDIEGARQLVDLLAAVDRCRCGLSSSMWLTALVPSISFSIGPAEEAAREVDDEQADQRDFDAGDQEHAVLHAGDLAVHAFRGSAARSSTPSTFTPAGCAWQAAWLHEGSL